MINDFEPKCPVLEIDFECKILRGLKPFLGLRKKIKSS